MGIPSVHTVYGLLVVLIYLLTTVASKVCPSGYTHNSDTCLSLSSSIRNWNDARAHCLHNRGDLISIHDQSLFDYLKPFSNVDLSSSIWVGANYQPELRLYQWVNGQPVPEDWWGFGQPDNSGGVEYCVQLWNGVLNDVNCGSMFRSICEVIGCAHIKHCQIGHQTCTHNSSTCSLCEDNKVFYKPILRDTVCGQMCSWNGFYCWPGKCDDDVVIGCACAQGFHKNDASTHVHCRCKNVSHEFS